jgi:hypothetical protein
MTVKEYLWQYRDALRAQVRMRWELEELYSNAEGLRGALSGGVPYTLRTKQADGTIRSEDAQTFLPHGKGRIAPTNALDTYLDKETETLRAAAEQVILSRQAVQAAISSVPDLRHQQLLSLRYIEGLIWEAVEATLAIDHATGVRWHQAAQDHLAGNFLKNIL